MSIANSCRSLAGIDAIPFGRVGHHRAKVLKLRTVMSGGQKPQQSCIRSGDPRSTNPNVNVLSSISALRTRQGIESMEKIAAAVVAVELGVEYDNV